MFFKIGVLKNFAIFTGKHLQIQGDKTQLDKKETLKAEQGTNFLEVNLGSIQVQKPAQTDAKNQKLGYIKSRGNTITSRNVTNNITIL